MHPSKVRGRELEFWNVGFLGELKIFLISGKGGVALGGGRCFLGEGHFILHPFSHFEMQD